MKAHQLDCFAFNQMVALELISTLEVSWDLSTRICELHAQARKLSAVARSAAMAEFVCTVHTILVHQFKHCFKSAWMVICLYISTGNLNLQSHPKSSTHTWSFACCKTCNHPANMRRQDQFKQKGTESHWENNHPFCIACLDNQNNFQVILTSSWDSLSSAIWSMQSFDSNDITKKPDYTTQGYITLAEWFNTQHDCLSVILAWSDVNHDHALLKFAIISLFVEYIWFDKILFSFPPVTTTDQSQQLFKDRIIWLRMKSHYTGSKHHGLVGITWLYNRHPPQTFQTFCSDDLLNDC